MSLHDDADKLLDAAASLDSPMLDALAAAIGLLLAGAPSVPRQDALDRVSAIARQHAVETR